MDIDIEGAFNFDRMNEALVMLQKDKPNSTLSFTLVVQGDNYGVSEPLGVDVLKNAAKHGVRVDVVNPMTMEFDSALPSYGEAVIAASKSTVKQMKKVWPEKTDAQLMKMLGITPMIGKNNNGIRISQFIKLELLRSDVFLSILCSILRENSNLILS